MTVTKRIDFKGEVLDVTVETSGRLEESGH